MTTGSLLIFLTTSALCLASGAGTLTASEWKNHYPKEAVVIQGVSSQITADLDESSVLYSYFAADSKIAYIEESFSTSMVAVCIRYLFDESGDFAAAACRISTQSAFSDEWTHSQKLLVRGQHLKVERCGISEAIDERAKHIMKRCLADWKQQSKKIRK